MADILTRKFPTKLNCDVGVRETGQLIGVVASSSGLILGLF